MDPDDTRQQSAPPGANAAGPHAALPPVPAGINCPDCGYDLRGLTGERCPECGFDLAIVRTQEPQIPWPRRHELGWFRAYWRTVWLVGRHPRRFCLEIVRPVSYRDSQSFRWVSALHAWVTLLTGSLLWYYFGTDRQAGAHEEYLLIFWSLQVIGVLVFALGPGIASYYFQSRDLAVEQQNRAIALSYYSTAPLACTPVALPPFALGLLGARLQELPDALRFGLTFGLIFAGIGLYCAALGLAGRRANLLRRHILHRSWVRRWADTWWVNILGVLFAFLVFAVPFIAFYLLIIWYSLR